MRSAKLAAFLATEARPLILERFTPDSCIVSTRIALDVAQAAGVRARRAEVTLIAANAEAVPLIQAGVPASAWPEGPHSVGCAQGATRAGGWPGAHLVAVLDDAILVDLAADQFHRPASGIVVPGPVVAPWVTSERGAVLVDDATGAQLHYYEVERPTPVTPSPDWHDEARRRPIVAELIRRGRAEGLIQ